MTSIIDADICNLQHATVLRDGFGCEVPSTIPMIARPAETQPRLLDIYLRTWRQEDFTFTKENYSVWKIPFFVNHFDIVAVYREPHSLWPPARYRVVTWYNAVYESILLNQADYAPPFQAQMAEWPAPLTIAERAEAGHALAIAYLLDQAKRWRLPVMTYGWLQAATEAALREWAASTVLTGYVDVEKWAREIVNTRRPPDQSDLTAVWSACRRKDTR